jgi:hypothetical protein
LLGRGVAGRAIVRIRPGSDVLAIAVVTAKTVTDPSPTSNAKINGGSASEW